MNRRVRIALAAVAAGTALFAAGCGSDTAANTAWADGVCGSAKKFTDAASKQPQLDQSNPQAAISGISTYLGSVITGADEAVKGLGSAGPSPVDGGDEAVSKLTTALNGYKTTFQQAKDGLDAADPNDPAALTQAVAPLQSLQTAPNPLGDLQASPELNEAAQAAPNCQALTKVGQTAGGGGGN